MNISFIIITNTGHDKKIALQIKSILAQKIENFQIIISGHITDNDKKIIRQIYSDIIFVDCPQEAAEGNLGRMRNLACDKAKYDYLVISDNDMLFSLSWYSNLLKADDFEIMTPKVLLPDGTRFWDHCCYQSPIHGHIILNPEEHDDYLYMSGGQSWIMKRKVFDKYRWDENITIYNMSNLKDYSQGKHNEDTEYSKRCRQTFKISHNKNVIVIHNDSSYTNIGRIILRRFNKNSHEWCKKIELPRVVMQMFANMLLEKGLIAEGLDILRKICIDHPNDSKQVNSFIDSIQAQYGGKLTDSEFTFNNETYKEIINYCQL